MHSLKKLNRVGARDLKPHPAHKPEIEKEGSSMFSMSVLGRVVSSKEICIVIMLTSIRPSLTHFWHGAVLLFTELVMMQCVNTESSPSRLPQRVKRPTRHLSTTLVVLTATLKSNPLVRELHNGMSRFNIQPCS